MSDLVISIVPSAPRKDARRTHFFEAEPLPDELLRRAPALISALERCDDLAGRWIAIAISHIDPEEVASAGRCIDDDEDIDALRTRVGGLFSGVPVIFRRVESGSLCPKSCPHKRQH